MKNIWFPILWILRISAFVVIHILPLFIYRFHIRKRPFKRNTARIIALCYFAIWVFFAAWITKMQGVAELFALIFSIYYNYLLLLDMNDDIDQYVWFIPGAYNRDLRFSGNNRIKPLFPLPFVPRPFFNNYRERTNFSLLFEKTMLFAVFVPLTIASCLIYSVLRIKISDDISFTIFLLLLLLCAHFSRFLSQPHFGFHKEKLIRIFRKMTRTYDSK